MCQKHDNHVSLHRYHYNITSLLLKCNTVAIFFNPDIVTAADPLRLSTVDMLESYITESFKYCAHQYFLQYVLYIVRGQSHCIAICHVIR